MGVYKRNNKWYCRGQINGERYHLPCTGAKNKTEAQSLEDGIRYKIRQIQAGIKKKKEQTYTFAFLMQNYLNACRANGRNMANVKSMVKFLTLYFGKTKNILNIKPSDIERYKIDMLNAEKCNGTVNKYLATLKSAYNVLIKEDLINYNPVTKVKLLEETGRRYRYLTKEEWGRLRKVLPKYLLDIVTTALQTGLRKQNVLQLKWEQINLDLRMIELKKTENKGKKEIKLPITDCLYNLLLSLNPKSEGYVFVNPDTGNCFTNIDNAWHKALDKAGIENFHFHDLRRTVGTWLLTAGVDIRTIQSILAHSNVSTTERYLALAPEQNVKAVQVLDSYM